MHKLVGSIRSAVATLLAVALLGFSLPAIAQSSGEALDALFARLRTAPDPITAHQIDQQIWEAWTVPSDPMLADRMRAALVARNIGDITLAMQLLDALVLDYPDYAEGWNQRATIHFMMGNLDQSIADCGRVLALEPRHFGALSGRALIYLRLGKRALALRDMAKAVAVHPFLNERTLFPELDRPPVTRV